MARFAVTITETLCKTLIVEAPDYFEAYDKIERAYNAGDIVLEADDFFDAVDKARETIESSEEIIAVNPWLEDPEEDLMT